jgi:uncharacterized iron-regulated membrane protein
MFKKINAWLHLWLGLISGIIVFILSVTGCLLVFKQEIRELTSPWMHVQKKSGDAFLPPSALHAVVQEAFPGRTLHSAWYHGENRSVHFTVSGTDSVVYVNPYSAEIIAIKDSEDFLHFIEDGHTSLWLPRAVGIQVVGWATMIFFVLLISGIILWWPKRWNRRSRQQAFTIKWKAGFKRLNYDLHNVLGFYALILAAVFAFTGLIMSFPWFSNAVSWLSGGESQRERPAPAVVTSENTVMLDQVNKAWLKGINELGQKNTDQIIVSFPDEQAEPIYLCVDMHNGTWRDIYLDQHTLEETPASQVRLAETNMAAYIRRINYGLHVGEIGGLPTKVIYFLGCLVCASLPVTGFCVWLNKKRKKKPRQVRVSPQLAVG